MRGRQRRPSLAPFPRRPLSTGLSSAEGEIIKIRVSQLNGCVFCLDLHSRQARKLGVPQQKLDLLPAWRESTLFSDREAALLAVAETATTLPLSEDSKADLLAARNTLGQETFISAEWVATTINIFNRISILSEHRASAMLKGSSPRVEKDAPQRHESHSRLPGYRDQKVHFRRYLQ